MNGFEKRRDDKKKAILQAALELFDRYGFDKVTVTEIAEKAHVSKVSIYNFFGSKDTLRRIVIKDVLDESIAKIKDLVEKDGDFIQKIGEYIQIRTRYHGRYSLQFFFDAVESDQEVRQYFADFTAANKRLVMEFIEKGRQLGVFSPDISDTAIEMYIDMFQSYITQNREVRDTLAQSAKLAQEVNMLFLNGLLRREGSKKD